MSTAEDRRWFAAVAGLGACVLCRQPGVQVSHSNLHRGLSRKSAPWMTAALCPACHHEIDSGRTLERTDRRELHARAINLTHDALIRAGRLRLV